MAKSKYDYDYKKYVIESGEYKKHKQLKKDAWKLLDGNNPNPIVTDEDTGTIYYYSDLFSNPYHHDKLRDCAARLINSKKRKVNLVRNKFRSFIESNKQTHWITLTFTNQVLKDTTYLQRRKAVREFLYSHGLQFIGTVDFGCGRKYVSFSKELRQATWREHYHILVSSFIDVSLWTLGEQTHITKTGIADDDIGRISQYISEASILAISHTSENVRLIYSRSINPLIRVHISPLSVNDFDENDIKTIPFYNMNNAISSLNKSKNYPIFMDNVL
jgi:hypothetical protein